MHRTTPTDVAPGHQARRTHRANALWRKVLAAKLFLEGFGFTVTPPEKEDERLRDVSPRLRAVSTR